MIDSPFCLFVCLLPNTPAPPQPRGGGLGIVDTGTTLLVPPTHAYATLIEAVTRGLRCSAATSFSSRCVPPRACRQKKPTSGFLTHTHIHTYAHAHHVQVLPHVRVAPHLLRRLPQRLPRPRHPPRRRVRFPSLLSLLPPIHMHTWTMNQHKQTHTHSPFVPPFPSIHMHMRTTNQHEHICTHTHIYIYI